MGSAKKNEQHGLMPRNSVFCVFAELNNFLRICEESNATEVYVQKGRGC